MNAASHSRIRFAALLVAVLALLSAACGSSADDVVADADDVAEEAVDSVDEAAEPAEGEASEPAGDSEGEAMEETGDEAAMEEEAAAEAPAEEEAAAPSGPVIPTADGGQLDFGSLEGKDAILWFWAPW